jgi:hypothetical protein
MRDAIMRQMVFLPAFFAGVFGVSAGVSVEMNDAQGAARGVAMTCLCALLANVAAAGMVSN